MSSATQTASGYLDVEGGRLYYEVAGQGHPLVFIHAGVADRTMWDEQWDFFAEQYRVIRYDTRGFGKTTTEEVQFSNRDDLYRLLRHLGVDKTYVIGLSRGGVIALDFTLEHPEMVDALIVVAGGVSGYDSEIPESEMALFNEGETLWEDAQKSGDFSKVADLDVRVWADGPGQREGRAAKRVRDRVYAMCMENYRTQKVEPKAIPLDPPAAGRLNEVRVPALVIVGDFDTFGTQASMRMLAQNVEGAKFVEFPGVAHMVNMEMPDEFNRVVMDFLKSLD